MQNASTGLNDALISFQQKVNENPRIKTLIKDWEPVITLESTDTAEKTHLVIQGCQLTEIVTEGERAKQHVLHLKATKDKLIAIFSGQSNPAEAFLQGDLEIFASDKDQVKLDAISLLVWGM